MKVSSSTPRLFTMAVLAAVAFRALTPLGYMPGSAGSGMLYELCPDGLPSGFMAALAGESSHGHHHGHHGGGDDSDVAGACPVGHMSSGIGIDYAFAITAPAEIRPVFEELPVSSFAAVSRPVFRSRAPPA